ncbi:MAG: hypothetical protein HYV28_21220 [Ignavibacteriales bacterium]|nr:hypothetical protein [Ignavibacteriales bacterium]MBI5726632.1 hypothetical protein [Ignavibacteriales bacterium]
MGQKLIHIYDAIAKEGSLKAKMDLAVKTKIPSTKAATEADTPENIAEFRKAFKLITGKECPIH